MPEIKFVVYMQHHDDSNQATGLSHSNGVHGFNVRAADMDGAISAVLDRCRQDSTLNKGWTARIVRLDGKGRQPPFCFAAPSSGHDIGIALNDTADRLW